jgi:predicted nucleic acid-binding protein
MAGWQQTETALLAPALLAFEVSASLRRMVYTKALTPARGDEAFAQFRRIDIDLSHREAIFPLAWMLAKQFNQPRTYDAAYLALAQLNNCEFWTADERLYNSVATRLAWVKWIGHYQANHSNEGDGGC